MNWKKILTYFVDAVIAALVAFWGYQLYLDFSALTSLPDNSKLYSLFTIKVLLFGLFIIIAITTVFYINMIEKGRKSPLIMNSGMDREILKKILDKVDNLSARTDEPGQNTAGGHETERKNAQEIQKTHLPDYSWYSRLLKAVNRSELLTFTVETLRKNLRAERLSIITSNGTFTEFRIAAGHGLPFDINRAVNPETAANALKKDRRIFVTNIETHPEFSHPNREGYKSLSFMILPFRYSSGNGGAAVCITDRAGTEPFSTRDLDIAQYISAIFILKWEMLSS